MERWSAHLGEGELEQHSEWLRGLARALIGDAAQAEDLAQDALVLLGRRDVPADGTRAFLRAVVRRLASQWRRSRARSDARERDAALDERVPSSDELVERLEMQELLVRTLRGLPEPYRDALTLRFFDGLEADEIARRTGASAGTVRSRIARGLDELRARLDQRYGDRRTWRLALLPLVRPRHAAAAGATASATIGIAGLVTMKWMLAAAVVLFAFLWTALVAERRAGPSTSEARAPSELLEAPRTDEHDAAAAKVADGEQREPASVAVAPTPSSPAAAPVARVVGRLVDFDRAPVEGAMVKSIGVEVASDSQGRFELVLAELRGDSGVSLRIDQRRFETTELRVSAALGETTWLGDVELERGGSVRGIVVDVSGAPVAGASVLATRYFRDADRTGRPDAIHFDPGDGTRSDAQGHFVIDGLADGAWTIWAVTPDRPWAHVDGVFAAAQSGAEVVVELAATDASRTIAGRVLDPSEHPVAGVQVQLLDTEGKCSIEHFCDTDELGRFDLRVDDAASSWTLLALDASARWDPIRREGMHAGEIELDLRFSRSQQVRVQVLGPGDRPIEGASVYAADSERALASGCSGATGRDGRAQIRRPADLASILVSARGFQPRSQSVGGATGEGDEIVVRLASGAALRGRVTCGGVAVPRALVRLCRGAPSGSVLAPKHWPFVCEPFFDRIDANPCCVACADERGEFVLEIPTKLSAPAREGWYFVAAAAGFATTATRLDPDLEHGESGLALELVRGGAIEGIVRVQGGDPTGYVAWAHDGLGGDVHRSVGPDGAFRLEGLAPGDWQVRALPPRCLGWPSASRDLTARSIGELRGATSDVRVGEGDTVRFDLDVVPIEVVSVELRLKVAAAPAGAWHVEIRDADTKSRNAELVERWLDADGSLRVRIDGAQARRVEFSSEDPRWNTVSIGARVEPVAGLLRCERELAFARISGSSATRRSTLVFCEQGDASRWCSSAFELSEAGRFGEVWVPAGHLRIVDRNGPAAKVLLELDLAADEARGIELP